MFDLLHKFKVTVETGNITKASAKLLISQPALTQALKNLEKQLGSQLLIRGKNGVKATQIGRTVYNHSRKLFFEVKNLKTIVSEHKNTLENKINFGMIDNVGWIFNSKVYKRFLLKFPKLNLNIKVDNTNRLLQQVEKGTIDFAIITNPIKRLSSEIKSVDFTFEKMILVGTLPIARSIRHVTDIPKHNFLTYNQDSYTYKTINQSLKNHGIKPKYKVFSTSPSFILQMTRLGTGISVLPKNLVMPDLQINILQEIELSGLNFQRELSLIYLKSTYLPKTTEKFIEELKKSYTF